MTLYIMALRMQKLILIWHFYFWHLLLWSCQSHFFTPLSRAKCPLLILRKFRLLEKIVFHNRKFGHSNKKVILARSNQTIIAANWYKITRWNPCQICPWQSRTRQWRWWWKPYTKKSPSFSGENDIILFPPKY